MRELPCPRDGTELVKVIEGDCAVYVCADDGGIWIPARSLKSFTRPPKKALPENTAIALAFGAPEDGPALCPEDGTKMRLRTHGVTTIDLCAKCGGVWLDAHEAERFFKVSRPTKLQKALRQADAATIPVLEGVSGVAQVLLELAAIII